VPGKTLSWPLIYQVRLLVGIIYLKKSTREICVLIYYVHTSHTKYHLLGNRFFLVKMGGHIPTFLSVLDVITQWFSGNLCCLAGFLWLMAFWRLKFTCLFLWIYGADDGSEYANTCLSPLLLYFHHCGIDGIPIFRQLLRALYSKIVEKY